MRPLTITAAFLLLALTAPAAAELPPDTLGRLLFTPAERVALRDARLRGEPDDSTVAPAAATPSVTLLRLDGIVHRSQRRSLAWINGVGIEDGGNWASLRVRTLSGGAELVDSSGRRIHLSVGQTLWLESGRILDPVPTGGLSAPTP